MTSQKLQIPCEVYSRVVGYMRPVDSWHKSKQQEFHDRKVFKLPKEAKGESS
jgi:ribonucleoside-triphosphate reductase (formate)